jgi:hypothetical protein
MKNILFIFLLSISFNINAQDEDYWKTDLVNLKKRWLRIDKQNFKNLMKFIDENKFDEVFKIENIKNVYRPY